ncbi:H-NS family nucleoid-associated regulatory protein [Belnapia sp. F-4-1]|uniref:H-NS histone family protein n=1 Tax=Belnapia sp. F-4-1 TaxID=1545443 RepID=UPI0009DDBE0C|nr:H-NS histone family protein [Belnapia sp. F-4-1]
MADKDAAAAKRIDLDRLTVPELRELIADAEAKLSEKQEKAKADLLAKWKAEAEENGLTLQALLPGISSPAAKAARKAPSGTLPAKYRGSNGEEWSGRGRLPKWLKALEAQGRKRDEYKI